LVFDFFQNRKNKRYLLDTSSSSSVLVCYKLQLNIVHSEREREEKMMEETPIVATSDDEWPKERLAPLGAAASSFENESG